MASADGMIDEIVTVGGRPGDAQGDAGVPGKDFEIQVPASRQYAAGSAYSWYVNLPRALPWAIDDIAHDFGSNIYYTMLKDAQVQAALNVYKASILEDGVSLAPPVTEKGADGYDLAADLADESAHMLSDLTVSLDDVLWDLLDAVAVGNRMAESVFRLDTAPSGRSLYTLETLAVKPRESVAFVVDAYFTVLGILARIPGEPFGVQQGLLLTDLRNAPNFLPRSKFAVLTWRPRNHDPRGHSALRPAFDPWNQKQQLKREFLKYLTQFASPSLVGFTAENADPYPLLNPDGTVQTDTNGNPIIQTPEQDMVTALQNFANGTATAFPYGAMVKPIEMNGDGRPFLDAFEHLDRQIIKAILHQTLATEEGQHQTRASSGTHKDVLDTIVRQGKRPLERMLRRDVLEPWVRLNHGPSALPLTPLVSLGQAEEEDKPRLWSAVASLQGSNYLHQSQYQKLDLLVGLPERAEAGATTIPTRETVQVQENAGTVPPPDGRVDKGGATTPPPDTTNANSER